MSDEPRSAPEDDTVISSQRPPLVPRDAREIADASDTVEKVRTTHRDGRAHHTASDLHTNDYLDADSDLDADSEETSSIDNTVMRPRSIRRAQGGTPRAATTSPAAPGRRRTATPAPESETGVIVELAPAPAPAAPTNDALSQHVRTSAHATSLKRWQRRTRMQFVALGGGVLLTMSLAVAGLVALIAR